ncbi:MAG: putative membrane protein [Candidatus Azotimanducaceae bacterium]|jgi:uncharacterized membrane protein
MTLLVIGIVLFFSIHLVPTTQLRATIALKTGEDGFKGLFSLVALAGFGLIVYGFYLSDFVPLFDPLPWGRTASYWIMPIAAILLFASNAPNNIKRFIRHPMLIGITLWSGTHLAANGDLASTLLFLSFGAFSIMDILLVEAGGRFKPIEPVSLIWDIGVVVGGILLFAILFYFHGGYTGVPLIQ